MGRIDKIIGFSEYGLLYRALLQKKLIILSILLTLATPYDTNKYDMHLWIHTSGWSGEALVVIGI